MTVTKSSIVVYRKRKHYSNIYARLPRQIAPLHSCVPWFFQSLRFVKAAKPSGKRQSRAAAAIRGAQLSWTTEEETDENTVTDDDQGTTTGGDAGGGNGGGGGNPPGELEE